MNEKLLKKVTDAIKNSEDNRSKKIGDYGTFTRADLELIADCVKTGRKPKLLPFEPAAKLLKAILEN